MNSLDDEAGARALSDADETAAWSVLPAEWRHRYEKLWRAALGTGEP